MGKRKKKIENQNLILNFNLHLLAIAGWGG